MNLWERLMESGAAAVYAWKGYGSEPEIDQEHRYDMLWSFYSGTWRTDPTVVGQRRSDTRVYQRTRLLWNLARATTRLYAQSVYQGDLSTDGKPLPDGTGGAIPIDPQTGNQAADDAIRRGCAELWSMWRWRASMGLATKYAAVLGDCLVELVDDVARGTVEPRHVWPGYVVDLELDLVGNVKRYALEYDVAVEESTAYGRDVKADRYRFRKEVDGEAFRYYRDGKPAAFPEQGIARAVEPNPYGFCPAVWFRHEIVPGVRGLGAFEPAVQTERELNGVLSLALDYQSKQFAAPVGVKGSSLGRSGADLTPARSAVAPDPWAAADAAAQTLNLVPMSDAGEFVTVSFDVGKTVEMVAKIEDALVAEFPEARFGQEILKMTEVTGPGVERALGPIIGNVKSVRSVQDPQMTKLHQMALAMIGFRLASGAYPPEVVSARAPRYQAFRPFDLGSYGAGRLDFGISDRDVILSTPEERLARLVQIEQLTDPWSLERAGVPPEVVARMVGERRANAERMASALTGIAAQDEPDEDRVPGQGEQRPAPQGQGQADRTPPRGASQVRAPGQGA